MTEQEWEQLLQIKTAGRDDSQSDGEHHPYEPTDYSVLERLANSGYIRKKDTLVDYGSGKGRVSIFMTYQTGCRSIGIEYDERLWQKAMVNAKSAAARSRVSFILADAAEYELPDETDCCFFFNPFALHTLKRVLGQIFDSLQRRPRPLRIFFYYPYEDVQLFWQASQPTIQLPMAFSGIFGGSWLLPKVFQKETHFKGFMVKGADRAQVGQWSWQR